MLVNRTAKIKIDNRKEIFDTIEVYGEALQLCIDIGWRDGITNNVKLQPFVYEELRDLGLNAQLAVRCIKQACGMMKRAKTKPSVRNISIGYNFPRSASIKNNVLSISTIYGRIKIPIEIPECYQEYFNSWDVRESLLRYDEKTNKSYFLFTFANEINASSNQHSKVLGIDVGVNKVAVGSDGNFYGHEIKSLRKKRDKLVSELQSKGTRACKRKLQKLSGWWKRFMTLKNHEISKQIVSSLSSGDVVVMEDLTYIRKTAKYNKWVHKWAFRQLQFFIEYKALGKGCRVVYINPRNTSKTCNRCRTTKTVRHSGFLECRCCSHCIDSDFNASRNIAQSYTETLGRDFVNKPNLACVDAEAPLVSVN